MGVYTKGRLFNAPLPESGTKLLSSDIYPNFDMSELRVHFCPSKTGRLSITRKEISTGVSISELLGTSNIGANEGVTYMIPTRAVSSYNFTFSVTNGTTLVLQVDEVAQ